MAARAVREARAMEVGEPLDAMGVRDLDLNHDEIEVGVELDLLQGRKPDRRER